MARERITDGKTIRNITWENTWGTDKANSFAWCKLIFDLTVSLYEDTSYTPTKYEMKCDIKIVSFDYQGNSGFSDGDGFCNIGCLSWNVPIAKYDGGWSADHLADESYAWNQHKQQLGIDSTNLITGFCVRDSRPYNPSWVDTEGIGVGNTRTFWYDITNDFDPSGSFVIEYLPIRYSTRFRNTDPTDPSQPSDPDMPWYHTVNVAYGTVLVDIKTEFKYHPWGRRLSGTWRSCNRSGGDQNRRVSGSWDSMWNNELNPKISPDNDGYRRKSNKWIKSPISGDE